MKHPNVLQGNPLCQSKIAAGVKVRIIVEVEDRKELVLTFDFSPADGSSILSQTFFNGFERPLQHRAMRRMRGAPEVSENS